MSRIRRWLSDVLAGIFMLAPGPRKPSPAKLAPEGKSVWKTIGLWLIRVLVTPEHVDALLAWLRAELLAYENRTGVSTAGNSLWPASQDPTFKARLRAEAERIIRGRP